MALMDIISLSSDKQAVILDIGHSFTKIGFAGELGPRHIIKSEIRQMKGSTVQIRKIFQSGLSKEEMHEIFREFIHMVYFKYLLVNPKERRVVICESIFQSVDVRNILAKVMFKHFDVVSLAFAPSDLLALFSSGLRSGLILDCGYYETSIVPVYEQTPIIKAAKFFPVASKELHDDIKSQILSNGIVTINGNEIPAKDHLSDINEDTLEDIKIRCCFVGKRGVARSAKDVSYPLKENQVLRVDGKLRAHAYDILFNGDEEDRSLATLILDSILSTPIDCRRTLAENVVLIGGSVMAPGFENRLHEELSFLLNETHYQKKIKMTSIKIKRSPVPSIYSSWQGGAIFGALEVLADHSISRDRYHTNPFIPDWASVLSHKEESKNIIEEGKYKWSGFRKSVPSALSAVTKSQSSPSTVSPATVADKSALNLVGLKHKTET